jgi:predicted alpha/beta superfamily hydrolase
MKEIKRFQVRGIPGKVTRAEFSGRIVDFWAPQGGSDHVLIAHDGQNIFDRKTATFLYTWKLTQTSIRIAKEAKKNPPLIIGVFHSSNKSDPHGRGKDLCPEDAFREGIKPASKPDFNVDELRGNTYLSKIFEEIAPHIAQHTNSNYRPEKTAMIGSSMGGLATLYSLIKHHDRFHTALALSPHWVLAGNPLVDWMIPKLPNEEHLRVWMSRGTKSLDALYEPFQNRADQLMRHQGWSEQSYISRVYHRTSHNERSWASYVDEPLKFWLY